MLPKFASLGLCLVVLLALGATSYAGSVVKRDVGDELEKIGDDIEDQIPKGALCINDDGCSIIEYCDTDLDLGNILDGNTAHCRIQLWFILAVAALAVVLIATLGVSCLCCPCCCLYTMCRKN